ncbi:MAG: hypothetical protein DPW16_17790 [Chloroflexi bacterium]|nr:hypothetical protein [Chloroflexota bacterium]
MVGKFNLDYPEWWDESDDELVEWAVSLNLRKALFQPKDAIMHYFDGRVVEVFDGWDHEHCHFHFCGQKISPYEGDEQAGYVDESGKIWFCNDCYERYILPALKG